tara:strand:- start:415 stop:696 length:282 start_codon:yes stop_codon:yes gene_type:complete
METIYERKKLAHEVLIEFYAYNDLRRIVRSEWEEEDEKFKNQCDKLYAEYEKTAASEKHREENSKSARIAKKLETMKMTDELVTKIKLRNEKR